MAREDLANLISKLRQMSEEGLTGLFDELMSNQSARRALGGVGERLVANKKLFDRNIETFLDFVNIPSKRDVRELKARLDHFNTQLMNLSIKLDRLLAAKAAPKTPRAKKIQG